MTRLLRRLARLEMIVPDVDATARFLTDGVGLVRTSEHETIGLSVPGPYGERGSDEVLGLVQGKKLGIGSMVFDVPDESALELLDDALQKASVETTRGPNQVSFVDPVGIPVTCHLPRPTGPELAPGPLRPRRLGHVNLKVPNAPQAGVFYQEVMGLRLSEEIGDLLVFLRVGNEHHNVGFRSGAESPGLHHVAFEIGGWETYRELCDHLSSLGYLVEYGPGRHGPGHNLFIYVVDPSSGLRIELFADMARVEDDHDPIRWESVDRVRTVNVWGPQPPKSFLE